MKEIMIFLLGTITGVTIILVTSCIFIEKYLLSSPKGDNDTNGEDCNCDDTCDCKDEKWIVE